MRYAGGEPFEDWQARARAKLSELLGMDKFTACDEEFTVEYVRDSEERGVKFRETRFTIQTEEGYRMPGHFCVPAGTTKPSSASTESTTRRDGVVVPLPESTTRRDGVVVPFLPVAVCIQGHTAGMHHSLGRTKAEGETIVVDDDFALKAMREGYCALVIEQRNFGECASDRTGGTWCHNSSMAAMLIGRTTNGERVWDTQRAIDALRHFPEADTGRIVCMGNSGGGMTTLYASCLEPRITHSMVCGYLCSYDDSIAAMYHCTCNFVPGMREFFDCGDLAGMIAPRPLVVNAGREDNIFPIAGVMKAWETVRELYEAAGAGEKAKLVVGEGGHRVFADWAWGDMAKMG